MRRLVSFCQPRAMERGLVWPSVSCLGRMRPLSMATKQRPRSTRPGFVGSTRVPRHSGSARSDRLLDRLLGRRGGIRWQAPHGMFFARTARSRGSRAKRHRSDRAAVVQALGSVRQTVRTAMWAFWAVVAFALVSPAGCAPLPNMLRSGRALRGRLVATYDPCIWSGQRGVGGVKATQKGPRFPRWTGADGLAMPRPPTLGVPRRCGVAVAFSRCFCSEMSCADPFSPQALVALKR